MLSSCSAAVRDSWSSGRDPAGIAHALLRVLIEPGLSARMSGHSADLAPQLL
jgi:hypothetical protein